MPGTRIAYVEASWHADILAHCKGAFLAGLKDRGYPPDEVDVFTTPGSLEIPLMAKKLAATGRYAAVCASGFVVDGGIYRHEFVAQAVLNGLVRVSLDTGIPVFSAVLTPHHFHEHAAHEEFFKGHMRTKGDELAHACVTMLAALREVEALAQRPRD